MPPPVPAPRPPLHAAAPAPRRAVWLASLALHGLLLSALALPRGLAPPPPAGPVAIALAWASPAEASAPGEEAAAAEEEAFPATAPTAQAPAAPEPPPLLPPPPSGLALAALPPLPDSPAPPPAAVIAPPPPEPPPAPEPVPDALPVAPAPVAAAAPPPAPPPPAPPREARRLAARPPDARIASAASGARPAATPVAAGAESAPAAPAGEPLSAALLPDSYRAALGARLRQALRYPPSARERDEEGDAILAFRVARDGSIRGAQILRSSGVAALDQEALALLARIAPAPPLPETWPAAEAAFVVPVRFRLR